MNRVILTIERGSDHIVVNRVILTIERGSDHIELWKVGPEGAAWQEAYCYPQDAPELEATDRWESEATGRWDTPVGRRIAGVPL